VRRLENGDGRRPPPAPKFVSRAETGPEDIGATDVVSDLPAVVPKEVVGMPWHVARHQVAVSNRVRIATVDVMGSERAEDW